MNLTLIASLISAAFAGAIGYGTAAHIYDARITEMKLEAANERIEIQRSNRITLERLTGQVEKAQNAAKTRNAVIRTDMDISGNSGSGLRLASTEAVRTSTTNNDACNSTVTAYNVILDEGITTIREMAGTLDQCISDNQALTEAWPKNAAEKTTE